MKRVSPFLLLTLALSTAAPAQTQIEAPDGWKTQTRANGAKTFTPPDLRAGEIYSITLYESAPLGGQSAEAYLREFAEPVGSAPGQLAAALQTKVTQGVVSGTGSYRGPNGSPLGALFFAASLDGGASVRVSRTLFSRVELLERYKVENRALSALLVRRNGRAAEITSRRGASTPSTLRKAVSGPLPPANLAGAKVFVKYYWTSYPTLTLNIGHLLLFPDGTAFDAVPSKPLASWSAAEIRKSVPRFDVGTWKAAGNKMILLFPQRQRDSQRTLTRNPRGWNDASEMAMNGENYNIYFPVTPPPRARLIGAWANEELGTAGTIGGAAPMVSGGSESDLFLRADGTFAGNSRSFFSSTTSNMGDAYSPDGDVFVSGKNRTQSAGKWRLDGPLLTLEKDGERSVQLAFLLPYWGKNAAKTDLMIGDDRWQRPKK